jgi:ribosomal protein L9
MEIPVSEKNTKAEILKAYESLLKNVQNAKADIPNNYKRKNRKRKPRLDGVSLTIGAKTSSTGTIFGSVTNIQIADELAKKGFEIGI